MNPQYTNKYLDEFYSGYITDEPEWEEPLLYCHNYYLSIIERFAEKGKLLDIGAGKGYLLQAAIGRGWQVNGYDVDEKLTRKLSEKYEVPVYNGEFVSLKLDENSYSAVTMHQVIEHLKDPVPYIKKIYRLLKAGGILFLAQPNIRSRSALYKLFMERSGVRKKNVGAYYDTSHHLFYYTPSVLKRFMENSGFKVAVMKSGHAARPRQTKIKRFLLRNFTDRILWKSTFFAVCIKI
jgi:2-polyprenyl-3-methyl-5-hydroxy-6-metoxy-1,4-benzoquinol methylase